MAAKNIFFGLLMFSFGQALLLSETAGQPEAKPADASSSDETLTYVNFEEVTLKTLLDFAAQLKGYNILPNKECADKKISLTSRKKMTPDQVWEAVHTLLAIHGFSVVKNGDVFKVVQSKDVFAGEPSRVFFSKDAAQIPDTDENVCLIYSSVNMKIDQMAQMFSAIVGSPSKTLPDWDLCIINGRACRIRNALEVIIPLDQFQVKQSMEQIQLRYTKADDIKRLLEEDLMGSKGELTSRIRYLSPRKGDVQFFPQPIKIIADSHKQSLILLGQKKHIEKLREFIERVLDVEWVSQNSTPHIYEVKNRKAEDVKALLEKVIRSANTGLSERAKIFKNYVISAERPSGGAGAPTMSGNRLLISCEAADWPKIRALIENVDSMPPQLVLEVMVVDATENFGRYLRGHIRDAGSGILGPNVSLGLFDSKNQTMEGEKSGLNSSLLSAGFDGTASVATFGDSNKPGTSGLWGYLAAAVSNSNSKIINQPFLIANNGVTATITDKDTRALRGNTTARGYASFQEFVPKEASRTIELTPRVNASGTVDIILKISIDEWEAAPPGDRDPNKKNRTINTRINVGMGECIVLGGLSKDSDSVGASSVPILSQIPILGLLFKYKDKSRKKTFLYVFIRPSPMRPVVGTIPDDYTRFKLDYAKLNIKRADTYAQSKDPVERFFFKNEVSDRDSTQDDSSDRYPALDDYWQRKNLPLSADIARDPFYRISWMAKEKWEKPDKVKKKVFAQNTRTLDKLKKRRVMVS